MTERIPRIVVVGPAFIDMAIKCEEHPTPGTVSEGSGLTCVPSGAGVNQSVQISQCGCDTYLLSRVGEDCFGEMIRENLARHRVHSDLIYSTQAISTGIMVTVVNRKGENSCCRSQGANRVLSRDEIEYAAAEQLIGSADAVLVNDSIPRDASVAAIRTAQIHKTRVVLHAKLPASDKQSLSAMDWPMEYFNVDIIALRFKGMICASELGSGGEGDLKFIGAELVARGANCVVISLGWRGALVIDRQGSRQLPGHANEVVDQNGCDSAFVGALTACFGTGDSPDRAVCFAIAAEALMRSRYGVLEAFPSKGDVLTLLQSEPD